MRTANNFTAHRAWPRYIRPTLKFQHHKKRPHTAGTGDQRMDKTTRRAICLMGSLALSGVATAQEPYPSRTITFVVPFAAGSGTDLSTRQMAASVAKATGVAVLVENRPGANGAIGAQYVARARPDGYTLLVGSATTNAANFAFYPSKLGYEPASFVMVAGLMGAPLALHVAAASPWKTVADLVRAAGQANGAKFNCGCGNAVTQASRFPTSPIRNR